MSSEFDVKLSVNVSEKFDPDAGMMRVCVYSDKNHNKKSRYKSVEKRVDKIEKRMDSKNISYSKEVERVREKEGASTSVVWQNWTFDSIDDASVAKDLLTDFSEVDVIDQYLLLSDEKEKECREKLLYELSETAQERFDEHANSMNGSFSELDLVDVGRLKFENINIPKFYDSPKEFYDLRKQYDAYVIGNATAEFTGSISII